MDLVPLKKHSLTPAQFEQLADVPPEQEWLANITNLRAREGDSKNYEFPNCLASESQSCIAKISSACLCAEY